MKISGIKLKCTNPQSQTVSFVSEVGEGTTRVGDGNFVDYVLAN